MDTANLQLSDDSKELAFILAVCLPVDTHGLTPVALAAEDHFISFEGFRTLKLPRKERFHLRAHARSPQLILDRSRQAFGLK
jgi:hypothetical protein